MEREGIEWFVVRETNILSYRKLFFLQSFFYNVKLNQGLSLKTSYGFPQFIDIYSHHMLQSRGRSQLSAQSASCTTSAITDLGKSCATCHENNLLLNCIVMLRAALNNNIKRNLKVAV